MKLYSRIAGLLIAIENCTESGNLEWLEKHQETLDNLCQKYLPSGSGFDSGCKLLESSKPECLAFSADFHHMDENGFYDGWTSHTVRIRASLVFGVTVTVSGRNRNDIKEYIADAFQHLADVEVD